MESAETALHLEDRNGLGNHPSHGTFSPRAEYRRHSPLCSGAGSTLAVLQQDRIALILRARGPVWGVGFNHGPQFRWPAGPRNQG